MSEVSRLMISPPIFWSGLKSHLPALGQRSTNLLFCRATFLTGSRHQLRCERTSQLSIQQRSSVLGAMKQRTSGQIRARQLGLPRQEE